MGNKFVTRVAELRGKLYVILRVEGVGGEDFKKPITPLESALKMRTFVYLTLFCRTHSFRVRSEKRKNRRILGVDFTP